MAAALVSLIVFYIGGALSSCRLVSAAAAASSSPCVTESVFFLYNLQSQCPLSITPNPPVQVDGNFLDRALALKQRNAYTSVLFYASWCSFSRNMHPKFEKLGLMFPQIEHLVAEQSAALPSVFSRYGVHSFPSLLIVNQTSKVRYRGPKTLTSLVQFYEKTTGLVAVQNFAEDGRTKLEGSEQSVMRLWSWSSSSLNETVKSEPYLVFAIMFLCLRVLLYIFPRVLSRLKAFCVLYVPLLNLEIFGETSQFGRALHMVDVRRVWTKLRLCKARNFHQGAKNARVWASSLASVSLGESSSARSPS